MKLVKNILKYIIIIIVIIIVGLIIYGYTLYKEKIEEKSIQEIVLEIKNNENFVSIQEVPKEYLNAIIAVEDHRYYNHGAIDIIALGRAFVTNIKYKEFREGGSTLTQQVAKNIYFISENNQVRRKVAELFMALELEKQLSKDEILEIYINTIYFGDGYYGIKEACNGYLKKEPNNMTLGESTMMAGIPNAPSVYAPTVNKKLCIKRQEKVVSSMVENGYLTEEEAKNIDINFINDI